MGESTNVQARTPLCTLCRRINPRRLMRGMYHHDSLKLLKASAGRCRLCHLFLTCLKEDPSPPPPDDSINSHRVHLQASYPLRIVCLSSGDYAGRLRAFTEKDDAAANIVLGRPIRSYAGHPENFRLARDWLTDCVLDHPECRSACAIEHKFPLLPNRVIDVGSFKSSIPPRLHISENEQGKWVALSHCWGKSPLFRLLKLNLESLKGEIPLSILPQTFRDAILITRELKVRYLWIDSLCILQDSVEDWEKESKLMPLIYSEAYVILQASSTATSLEGILTSRESSSCTVQFGRAAHITFDYEVDHHDFLEERAWCFQEDQLSSRHLCFYKSHMMFSCTHGSRREYDYIKIWKSPRRRPNVNHSLLDIRNVAEALNIIRRDRIGGGDASRLHEGFHQYWSKRTGDYSSKELTVSSDKLVAISGVARQIGEYLGDQYLAGLWRSNLALGLLWKRSGSRGVMLQSPSEYRAPSWSWASLDGMISMTNFKQPDLQNTTCDILEVTTTPKGTDIYGQIRDGKITLRAPLKEGRVGPTIFQHVRMATPYVAQYVHLIDPAGSDAVPHRPHLRFDTEVPPEGTPIVCIQLLFRYVYRMPASYGLIIERTATTTPGEYRRIGMFELTEDRWERDNSPGWFKGAACETVTIV